MKLTESSDGNCGLNNGRDNGSLGTEEDDEDDLLKEDISNWDVFDDFHKFQLREQKMKDKRRREA